MCGFRFRSSRAKVFLLTKRKKIVLYLSVRVFSTKVLTGDTIFTSPTGDGTLPVCRAKAVPSFLSYF